MQLVGQDVVLEEMISKKQYDQLQLKNLFLEQQLNELKRLIYGAKSERFLGTHKDQLHLFDVKQGKEEKPSTRKVTYERRVGKRENPPVRATLPSHLPRVTEVIEPDNLEEGVQRIGEEVTEILEYNPANIFVRRIVRPKYAVNNTIEIANLPTLPLPKSNAGASMLAYIAISKFIDHLPFYRQRQIFKRQDFIVSDSTLGGWFSRMCNLVTPLYEKLEELTLDSDYLQMDESPIGVQDSHKKQALHTGYQWVIHNPVKGLVLFKYAPSRSRGTPQQILENFKGTLQTDGYGVYQNLKTNQPIKLLACLAHGRRYFEKALENDSDRACYAMEQIQLLYKMERKAKDKSVSPEVLQRYRQVYALPILEEMEAWMKKQIQQVLPKSAIGKAIAYNLNIWKNVKTYTWDGRYHIDNNPIESQIRPLALGRKNYLFAGSHKAAQNIAMMYSFFATCKINQVEPLQWLTHVLSVIPDYKVNQLVELLPNKHIQD